MTRPSFQVLVEVLEVVMEVKEEKVKMIEASITKCVVFTLKNPIGSVSSIYIATFTKTFPLFVDAYFNLPVTGNDAS